MRAELVYMLASFIMMKLNSAKEVATLIALLEYLGADGIATNIEIEFIRRGSCLVPDEHKRKHELYKLLKSELEKELRPLLSNPTTYEAEQRFMKHVMEQDGFVAEGFVPFYKTSASAAQSEGGSSNEADSQGIADQQGAPHDLDKEKADQQRLEGGAK